MKLKIPLPSASQKYSGKRTWLRALEYLFFGAILHLSNFAQAPPGLELQVYAGLSITGAVGTVYSIEYTTDVAPTNNWRCLEFLRLPATNFLWFDSTAPATEKRFYRATSSVRTNLAFIPPGIFRMGSPSNELDRNPNPNFDEGAETEVTISHGFYMGKHEVTQAEYRAIIGSNPSSFTGDTNRPVESVSWFNATTYCSKLTAQERAAGRISTNSLYRLPTEAEWEYACRALTSTRFNYGDDLNYAEPGKYMWYADNSDASTQPVAQKLPNRWGLFDMHGNVGEWCQDWYGLHLGGIAIDPQGPAKGSSRVVRGGVWLRPASFCRSAMRVALDPNGATDGIGFRVVLAPR